MKITICESRDEAAGIAAEMILSSLKEKPDLVLGLATGSTPCGVYARLVDACHKGTADFSRVRTFNLDEYLDLGPGHPQSYRAFMRHHLFDGVNIPPEQIHFPPAEGDSLLERCQRFEEEIRAAGGIDVQLLGIGSNGHIGFNEPTSSLRSRTRVQTLTTKTLLDNGRYYSPGEFQPQMAVTMGIGTILEARRIVLQAFGTRKADAIRATVEGPVSAFCPGSALQLHPQVLILLDGEAASRLSMRDFFMRARENEEELRHSARL
jgi:glucosamine-6-phosphate deaminase